MKHLAYAKRENNLKFKPSPGKSIPLGDNARGRIRAEKDILYIHVTSRAFTVIYVVLDVERPLRLIKVSVDSAKSTKTDNSRTYFDCQFLCDLNK